VNAHLWSPDPRLFISPPSPNPERMGAAYHRCGRDADHRNVPDFRILVNSNQAFRPRRRMPIYWRFRNQSVERASARRISLHHWIIRKDLDN
jgi:hypothetical protein